MTKVIVSFNITKPYVDWKKVFDSTSLNKDSAGLKTIYVGHEMEKKIKESEHVKKSTKTIVCSD